MPLTLRSVTHEKLCHGSRWVISNEDDLACKVAYLALGQSRHVAKILSHLDPAAPQTRADAARGAINLLTVPQNVDPYHRDGWIFQAISWIAAYKNEGGAIVRAPHSILAHKGFDGMQLKLDVNNEKVISVLIFEDKATENDRSTIREDVWAGIRALESGERIPELIQETGALLAANQLRFRTLDIDAAIETIAWDDVRSYRVAITVDAKRENDKKRMALFKGFDTVAPGALSRRQAETMYIPELRKWMDQFANKAIKQIENWRDNV